MEPIISYLSVVDGCSCSNFQFVQLVWLLEPLLLYTFVKLNTYVCILGSALTEVKIKRNIIYPNHTNDKVLN